MVFGQGLGDRENEELLSNGYGVVVLEDENSSGDWFHNVNVFHNIYPYTLKIM